MTTLIINLPLNHQLVNQGLLAEEQWNQALETNGRDLSETLHWLVENNAIAPDVLLNELVKYSELPMVDFAVLSRAAKVDLDLPYEFLKLHRIAPFGMDDQSLQVAMADPFQPPSQPSSLN